MPKAIPTCCTTVLKVVARLTADCGTSAKAMVLIEVNCIERKKPPTANSATISAIGVDARKKPGAMVIAATIRLVTASTRLKPKRRMMAGATGLNTNMPAACAALARPAFRGDQPSPT